MAASARSFRERGLSVVPVVGKAPERIAGWQKRYGRLQPFSSIKADVERIGATGFGIVLGQIVGASPIACVDIEVASVVAELLPRLPRSLTVKSPSAGAKVFLRVTGDLSLVRNIPGSLTGGRVELLWTGKQAVVEGYYPGKKDGSVPPGFYTNDNHEIVEIDASVLVALIEAYLVEPLKVTVVKPVRAVVEKAPVLTADAAHQVAVVESLHATVGLGSWYKPLLAGAQKGKVAEGFRGFQDWFLRLCEIENAFGPENGMVVAAALSQLCSNWCPKEFERQWATVLDADLYEAQAGKKARRKASLGRWLYTISPELRGEGSAKREAYVRKENDKKRIRGAQAAAFNAEVRWSEWAAESLKGCHQDGLRAKLIRRVVDCRIKGQGLANIGAVAEMATEYGVTPQAVSKELQRMGADGLIARTRGNAMGKEVLVTVITMPASIEALKAVEATYTPVSSTFSTMHVWSCEWGGAEVNEGDEECPPDLDEEVYIPISDWKSPFRPTAACPNLDETMRRRVIEAGLKSTPDIMASIEACLVPVEMIEPIKRNLEKTTRDGEVVVRPEIENIAYSLATLLREKADQMFLWASYIANRMDSLLPAGKSNPTDIQKITAMSRAISCVCLDYDLMTPGAALEHRIKNRHLMRQQAGQNH